MAPRRLIIVMVLLLAFSTALAILVPGPEDGQRREQQAPPKAVERPTESSPGPREKIAPLEPVERDTDRVIERSIVFGGSPERLSVRPGDRLVLGVESAKPVVLELTGSGLVDPAGPYDPARFDLLVRERPKLLVVRELGTEGPKIAVIEVR